MGPHIEHTAVVTFMLLGQFIGHFALRWANRCWHFLPATSGWLITLGIVAGLVAYFAIIWLMIGLILLAGKLFLADVEVYDSRPRGPGNDNRSQSVEADR